MKPLTRRSVIAGSAAAVTAIPAVGLCKGATPDLSPMERIRLAIKEMDLAYSHLPPVSPAEYVAEMEANGWRPLAPLARDGSSLGGVVEYSLNDPPTWQDMQFLGYMNRRVAKSGSDFYKRAASYLADHGREQPWQNLMPSHGHGYRPKDLA